MSRNLNIGSALLFIIGIVSMIYGLQELFLVAYLDEELLGLTAFEIGAFNQNLLDVSTGVAFSVMNGNDVPALRTFVFAFLGL